MSATNVQKMESASVTNQRAPKARSSKSAPNGEGSRIIANTATVVRSPYTKSKWAIFRDGALVPGPDGNPNKWAYFDTKREALAAIPFIDKPRQIFNNGGTVVMHGTVRKTDKHAGELPPSHLAALHEAGFTVIRYLDKSVQVRDGAREWLPSLCIALNDKPNSYRVIEWLPQGHPANHYHFDGWQVTSGHTSGGMYQTIGRALAWFTWHEEQKAKSGW